MSKVELLRHGANQSLIHVDMMIGSREMDVDGITANGAREPMLRMGEWLLSRRDSAIVAIRRAIACSRQAWHEVSWAGVWTF